MVRPWHVLYIFTWKCASRHSGVQFFEENKVRQATKKNKLQTHFGPLLLLSCQTCLGIVCLHVSTLPVSDQIWALHAVSVLSTVDFQTRQQQQQRTNHNNHVWNILHSKSMRFCDGFAKKNRHTLELYQLSALVVTTASFRKDVAKKVARDWAVFQGLDFVNSCHRYFSLFGFWFMIEDCQLIASFRTITQDSFNRSSRQLNRVRANIHSVALHDWTVFGNFIACISRLQAPFPGAPTHTHN